MPVDRSTLTGLARTGGFLALGVVATALLATGLLYVTRSIQPSLYRAFYGSLGPSDATRTAMLGQFVLVAAVASTATPLVVAAVLDGGRQGVQKLSPVIGAVIGLLLAIGVGAIVGAFPVLAVLALLLPVLLLAVPVGLHYGMGVRSPALPTLAGAAPVVLALFVLLAFGIGWGWGYVLVAETASPATVDDASVADFDSVPAVSNDLFTASTCSALAGGGERCILYLRGYEHEQAAARFLSRNGVHCPYVNAPAGEQRDPGSFLAEHDGTYYRVTCAAHGD